MELWEVRLAEEDGDGECGEQKIEEQEKGLDRSLGGEGDAGGWG